MCFSIARCYIDYLYLSCCCNKQTNKKQTFKNYHHCRYECTKYKSFFIALKVKYLFKNNKIKSAFFYVPVCRGQHAIFHKNKVHFYCIIEIKEIESITLHCNNKKSTSFKTTKRSYGIKANIFIQRLVLYK